MEDEIFAAPPPERGELIIATPERLEAIVRSPANGMWLSSLSAVCVDEAHLISSPHRGPTLEHLITTLLTIALPPRLILLSATLGDTERAREWLAPSDVISIAERRPPLRKEVLELAPGEDANGIVAAYAREALGDPEASIMIFVYQTRSAENLSELLRTTLGELAGNDGPLAYHAQMSAARREEVRRAFSAGKSRCLVSTTALGLGVNLPATHVLVRDATFPGVGPLSTADLLQMMGRAGRGAKAGHAAVIVRGKGARSTDELASELREERLPALTSHYERVRIGRGSDSDEVGAVATHVAAQLSRMGDAGLSDDDLRAFFDRSLGGKMLSARVPAALTWLVDPARALAWRDEHGRYRLTVLGLRATRATLPLDVASGFGQLIRDLVTISPDDRLIERWGLLDHLIVLDLLSGRSPALRPFSASLADQVDAWMEGSPGVAAVLYREWIAGEVGASRAAEVLGSLGVDCRRRGGTEARKVAYLAVFRSILLYELGQGETVADIERRWSVRDLEGVEERWRDDTLWLLSGAAQALELRSFYYHLREACEADDSRVRRVKRLLRRMRAQTFELQEHLKYCSPLGPVLRSLRRTRAAGGATVGAQSIRRLEDAGVRSFAELARLGVDDMVRLGVRRDLARQIRRYVQRRLQ